MNGIQWSVIAMLSLASIVAVNAAPTVVLPPPVGLSADPLYAVSNGDKPAMVLALSVEFPTVGAQYVASPGATDDATYTPVKEYLGYYDAEACYRYNDQPTEAPVAPLTSSDYKRFDRTGPALPLATPDPSQPFKTSRRCADAFSGNFLNWSGNSAIDMLRLALTGGDRYIDTPSLTVLQRAVIPNGDPTCMWNSSNFPAKQLLKNGGGTNAYWGAVPIAMVNAAGGSDIWVANTLNRMYFGTSKTGGCGSTAGYTLGAATTTGDHGPVVYRGQSRPNGGFTQCATEGGSCSGFTGVMEVWYGTNNDWNIAQATSGVRCDNATFGDPIPGQPKACYYRQTTGVSTSWSPPASAAGMNSDGFFFSRVQVCNTNNTGALQDVRDYPLCTSYSAGNYKPTGAIQKYSDQLRLAAFGYLMDQTNSNTGGRYGGVLRAPMKYVGPKSFDNVGAENTPAGGNPGQEWDPSNGVFRINPDNDTTFGKSGVITYLNQFGRTGSTVGRYKLYDPVGEMHGEALRYLQGLQPTALAISGLSTPMYDGFPVSTVWSDPYGDGRTNTADYSCLKSNIVVIGDVNTWDSNRLLTRSADITQNLPDIGYWLRVAQDFEAGNARSYPDGQNAAQMTGNPNSTRNYTTSYGVTGNGPIIGSAYWAHTHDIRGANWTAGNGSALQRHGLRVKTFTFDVNEYAQQTNPNARRYGNQFFTAAKYGGFETDPSNPGRRPFNNKGNPFQRDDGTVDPFVWQDSDPSATRTGEAQTYYLQSDARGVLGAFDAIFSRAATQARSIAGGALSNANLVTAGSSIYQAAFDTTDWSGDLLSQTLTLNNGGAALGSTPTWSAANRLGLLPNPAQSRNIIMGRSGGSAIPKATNFTWDLPAGGVGGGIDVSVRTALGKPNPSAAADGFGEDRLKYLRGDRTKERNPFRARSKLLGDIINSGVVYSGAPTTKISDPSYQGFYTANAGRAPAVFVGANDGMLHAFNAGTGDELFAYIPSWLAPRLSALTHSDYLNNHQSYVDGQSAVAEVKLGNAGTAADWATVLIGSTGNGGQGIFALDVTNPTAFNADKVMWEFTDADDPDLGNVVGRPQILKFRTTAPNVAPAVYKHFAVFGGGVNNYVSDGNASANGNPALFLLDLGKPSNQPWSQGINYFKIVLPMDATVAAANPSGLINFGPAGGSVGEVAQIYMGDLHGSMWKLDFSLNGTSNWTMAKLSTFNKGTASLPIPYPLYLARDGSGKVQPISAAPALAYGPTPESTYVLFGTGKYLEQNDRNPTAVNSVYNVFDNGSSAGDAPSPIGAAAIRSRARLQSGVVNATSGVVTVAAFNWGRASVDNDPAKRSGWYFDFPIAGERQVSNAKILPKTNIAVLGSLIPGVLSTTGACSADSGGGNQYTLNMVTGSGTSIASSAGILGEPMVVQLPTLPNGSSDSTGRRNDTFTSQVLQQGSQGLTTGRTAMADVATGRLSWRQINNYLDLRNAP